MKKWPMIIIVTLLIAGAGVAGFFAGQNKINFYSQQEIKQDKQIAFLQEIFQTIQKNYWKTISDKELSQIFILASEKLSGQSLGGDIKNSEELFKQLEKLLAQYQEEDKKIEFAATVADAVLANLQPASRSRLYSQKQEQELANTVKNIQPDINQYEVLGVEKNVDQEQIKASYQNKKLTLDQELAKNDNLETRQAIANLEQAHNALKDIESRKLYDAAGVEPTMEYRLLTDKIFYLHIKKFSPTTVEELSRVTKKVDQGNKLNTLILDLRDNVGGAIDGLPYFLGPFIGPNQYAYQFFQQDEVKDFKTKTGWLSEMIRYKKIVVLINENTQSSAEVMASVLKKYNAGVLLGSTTKGWGTVERIFTLDNQMTDEKTFSVFLVHHLTLREDGESIEGNGVIPDININDSTWQAQLKNYYNDDSLINEIKKLLLITTTVLTH